MKHRKADFKVPDGTGRSPGLAQFAPKQDFIEWCRRHFAGLNDGAVWAVPRSGLVFTRRGKRLVLTQRLPYCESGLTGDMLAKCQDRDYASHRRHFQAAGIMVSDETRTIH